MDEEVEIILQQDSVEVTEPLVADYVLPTASTNILGGVKIGDNINIDNNGHISVPTAGSNVAGVIKVGTGLAIDSNGVLSQDTSTLPQATKNTLGVVYVDDELNDNSQNPVQNAVVSLELAEITGTTDGLTNTVNGLSTTVGNLSTSLGNLSTSLGNLSTAVTNNTNAIGTCESNISTINDSITGINNDITDLGNTVGAMGAVVDDLADDFDEVATASDVDSNTWTVGDIQIRKRGRTGVIYITLEGSLTLSSLSYTTIYTQSDQDNLPAYTGYSVIYTDAGCVYAEFTTSGELNIYNNSTTTLNIGELKGSIPILYT